MRVLSRRLITCAAAIVAAHFQRSDKVYLFELFDESGDSPVLPIFGAGDVPYNTLAKLGLDAPAADNMLTWDTVCATIIGQPMSLYREVRPIISESPNPQLTVKYVINALANRHYYGYRAMRDIIAADYNPIANYDMRETSTTTYNGGQTVNNTQTTDTTASHTEDAATDSTEYGATTNTTTAAAVTDTSETPQTTVTTNRGATNGTATTAAATTTEETRRDVYGYNSPAAAQPESTDTKTLTAPEQTTTQTTDAATDSVVTDAVTVTNNLGARSVTAADAEHTDTTTRGKRATNDTFRAGDTTTETTYNNRSDVTQLTRSGNIGVTTSQQLLLSELQLRRATEYINTLATDIVNALTVGIYGLGGI